MTKALDTIGRDMTRKRGPKGPMKRTDDRRGIIIQAILNDSHFKWACKAAGLDPQTVRTWMKEDDNFNKEIEGAQAAIDRARGRLDP